MDKKEYCSSTQTLSEYVARSKFEDIPKAVCEDAKDYILDSIGCMIGGSVLEPGKIIVDFFTGLGGYPESSILATGTKLPCIHAAYVNSYLANLLDLDDSSNTPPGHPGATIICPGLALAEKIRASVRDFITAVVTAYEVWSRIALAISSSPERTAKVRGFGTHQIFGAAVVSSKLLGFNTEQVANALGLAGVNAPVPSIHKFGMELEERPISWAKNNYGWASMGGVLAAFLTEKGFVGNKHILDGERGFWIMAGSDQCDFNKMTLDLGVDYHISRVGFKPYASCRWTHTSLDATAEIMAKYSIDINRIRSIKVSTYRELVENGAVSNPATILDAQFSLPHLIALELLGKSSRKGLLGDDLTDPRVRSLAEKVSLELSPEMEEGYHRPKRLLGTIVSIEQVDGNLFSERVDVPKWEPEKERPTREELQSKFTYLAAPVVGVDASDAIIDSVERLQSVEDISAVIPMVREKKN